MTEEGHDFEMGHGQRCGKEEVQCTPPLTLSGETSNTATNVLEDHGCWDGQGSLPAAQPELSASSRGTEVLSTPSPPGTPPHLYELCGCTVEKIFPQINCVS